MMATIEMTRENSNFQFLLRDIADIENLKCNIDMFEKIIDEKFLVSTI